MLVKLYQCSICNTRHELRLASRFGGLHFEQYPPGWVQVRSGEVAALDVCSADCYAKVLTAYPGFFYKPRQEVTP